MRIVSIIRLSIVFSGLFFLLSVPSVRAQKIKKSTALVYVDKEGVMRWTTNNAEANFFGVNYTAPFAYSYRAHKALGVDIEQAIRQDVYHMARLGLDAFRVHVWDTEISDSLGNLLENDHLRLFDFLLAELKKRNIRVIITPIAFWGNGYPERDERTPGFSRVFGKGRATVNDTAIRAQENYLRQFFKHVNPYTRLDYVDDPDVIAVELNNEPSHSGPKAGVTSYIDRLAAAVRSDGWTKPLFYNISQSPYYADAVAASDVNGFSFQWYPSGLVAGYEQKGNYLPNVDRYPIPFDTIPAFHNKARMVYEFESADVLQSYMYPAMARSFREAGFQWVTQFAYDPLALAYANTEYQTHYLNLAYTPSKAISILIASRVFHEVPRLAHYGTYPADSLFAHFRVSYRASLSEMNSGQEFYYTNTTDTKPADVVRLLHLAGVGSSPVVRYEGTGAYFLDKVREGLWRLEVMPDAIPIRDPFGRPSPEREVTRIQWERQPMRILLPDLGQGFTIRGLNEGNAVEMTSRGDEFIISPGTYLVSGGGAGPGGKGEAGRVGEGAAGPARENAGTIGVLGMNEFVAPKPFASTPYVANTPYSEVTAGRRFVIRATIAGVDSADKISLQVSREGGGFGRTRLIDMTRETSSTYVGEVPVGMVEPGILGYRVIIHRAEPGSRLTTGGEWFVFPGGHKGDPSAWDYINTDHWQTVVAAGNSPLEIFSPAVDQDINIYPSYRRGFQRAVIPGPDPGRMILRLAEPAVSEDRRGNNSDDQLFGFQYFFRDKLKGRETERFDKLFIRARAGADAGAGTGGGAPVRAKVTLTTADAMSYSAFISLDAGFRDIEVPLDSLVADSVLLLPRPYPGFLPLWFHSSERPAGAAGPAGAARPTGAAPFRLSDAERIQVTVGMGGALEVESIWIK